ncbi:hypothetical protein LVJ94_38620 [Pendulispora rubella]|uniref:Uncharacterized protein n=1 Tax=Pendulispora rubella TaxID=2741070 RepID=A0ABZ2KVU6_9BACT
MAGGRAWITVGIEYSTKSLLYSFANGVWSFETNADFVHAFNANDVWISNKNRAGRLGSTLLESEDPYDRFYEIAGASPTDVWLHRFTGKSLVHSDGTSLRPVPGLNDSFTDLFIGGTDWGFIGGPGGGFLKRDGAESFVPTSPPPLPGIMNTSMWGTGPADVYSVGSNGSVGVGLAKHWDGCQWSVVDFGRKIGTLRGVWATGSDVWITGYEELPGDRKDGFLLHKDASGKWTYLPQDPHSYYVGVWGSAANDVWFAGPNFMHWDGSTFTKVPLPDERRPTADLLSGSAADDIWAVHLGKSNPLFHYDGRAWTAQPGPEVNFIRSIAKNDVWATSADGSVHHYDGATWRSVGLLPGKRWSSIGSIWANGPNDVWFGENAHWDGSAIQFVHPISSSEDFMNHSMWGDGTLVWTSTGHVHGTR